VSEKPCVMLESPYAAKTQLQSIRHVFYAREAMRHSLEVKFEAPLPSHLLYTQVLDDDIPLHREIGIGAGMAWLQRADYVVLYTDFGVSKGMEYARKLAESLGLDVVKRQLPADTVQKINEDTDIQLKESKDG